VQPQSIQHYHNELATQVVAAKGEKWGPDGMYENHLVVMASSDTAVTSHVGIV